MCNRCADRIWQHVKGGTLQCLPLEARPELFQPGAVAVDMPDA